MWAVTKHVILKWCPEYVQFNKSIIDDIIIEDAERLEYARIENDDYYARDDSESEQSDYSETEHMKHLLIID